MTLRQSKTKEPTPLDIAGVSNIGCVRSENQDAWLVDETNQFAIIADGIGGGPAGSLAAQTVVQRLAEIMRSELAKKDIIQQNSRQRVAHHLLQEAVLSVSREIQEESADNLELRGMGATVVAAWRYGSELHVAHQGDSRAYLFRNGHLKTLTADHSIVALLLRSGEITEQEAINHPARGQLTRFVGMPGDVYCDLKSLKIKNGDRLLLCTDGLWGVVKNEEIAAAFLDQEQPGSICNSLVQRAIIRGAPDNVTSVVWNL